MSIGKWAALFFLATAEAGWTMDKDLRVGVGSMPSWDAADTIVGDFVLRRAFKRLKEEGDLPENLHFDIHTSTACNSSEASTTAAEMVIEKDVSVILGVACTDGLEPVGKLMAGWNIPVISNLARGTSVTDKAVFPTTSRVSETSSPLGSAIVEFMMYHNWTDFALIGNAEGTAALRSSIQDAENADKRVTLAVEQRLDDFEEASMDKALRTVAKKARIIVLAFDSTSVSGLVVAQKFIKRAHYLNMTGPDWVYIIPDGLNVEMSKDWFAEDQTSLLGDFADFRQSFVFRPVGLSLLTMKNFLTKMREWIRLDVETASYNLTQIVDDGEWHVYLAMNFHDAAYLYGKALGKCLQDKTNCHPRDGRAIVNYIRHTYFEESKDTEIYFRLQLFLERKDGHINAERSEDGRESYIRGIRVQLRIRFWAPQSQAVRTIVRPQLGSGKIHRGPLTGNVSMSLHLLTGLLFVPSIPALEADGECWALQRVVIEKEFPWTGGRVPLARPRCGFGGDECPVDWTNTATAFFIVSFVGLIVVGLFFYNYRKRKFESGVLNKNWEIPITDLRFEHSSESNSVILYSRNVSHHRRDSDIARVRSVGPSSTRGTVKWTSGLEISLRNLGSASQSISNRSREDAMFEVEGMELKLGYAGRAMIDRQTVAIHQYYLKNPLNFSRLELVQLKHLTDMRCDNLANFFGLCLGQKDRVLAIWEHCRKGSLYDVLHNDAVDLDETFKCSIIRDIILGLEYLHRSPLGVHGQLTADNCLVDSRWSVKLTDFGLHHLFRSLRLKEDFKMKPFSADKLLHIAPELLGIGTITRGLDRAPTVAADIYGLGMIMCQVMTRAALYDYDLHTEQEVITKLMAGHLGHYKPTLPEKNAENEEIDQIIPIIKDCWNPDPADRPALAAIRRVVCGMRASRANLTEHAMNMMEKYAGNLEKMIQERTIQLQEERKRADDLLVRMLPAVVAEELKAGKVVPPVSFECVSIYFSDIVGFTSISGRSQPLEVVNFLNYLYVTFDDLIEQYDAYKVETIGDAYMVASGLPKRNGFQHCIQIADLSLAVLHVPLQSQGVGGDWEGLQKVQEMRVPHFPGEGIQIRIGVHSGPCAAGVVGNTMPRYCLFGDTVNTASRMESTGEAMKIQCSDNTKVLLLQYGEDGKYDIEHRGSIPVKGKGDLSTYWLHSGARFGGRIAAPPSKTTVVPIPKKESPKKESIAVLPPL